MSLDRALAGRARLLDWLSSEVFPLWGSVGVDATAGGFFEKITADGEPTADHRRARVVARQIYSFSNATKLGWTGPAEDIVRQGVGCLSRYVQRDGRLVPLVARDGMIVRDTFDLYDHAFVLFGIAAAVGQFPWASPFSDTATAMRDSLSAWKHPRAGFEEANPRALPLKANPHMHMLEAALAWVELRPGDLAWSALADEIAELALDRFVCHRSGALFEFYDGDWRPSGDRGARLVEPGHQCEWGWLLMRWGEWRGQQGAIEAGRLMIAAAEHHGVDPRRGVMFNGLTDEFQVLDGGARLWPQTERIKGWLAMHRSATSDAERAHALERVASAIDGLLRFRRVDLRGSYFDRMEEDGMFREEPAPASSLYHIVCAARELQDVLPS